MFPFSNTPIFVVPPPISRLATICCVFLESSAAPAPFPANTDSKSAPAVATTKSPAISEIACTTSLAFCFLDDSPVIMTAPVARSCGTIPAVSYSLFMILLTASPSISSGERKGVKYTLLLYRISLSITFTCGIRPNPPMFCKVSRLNTNCVVDVPISIPALKICSCSIAPSPLCCNEKGAPTMLMLLCMFKCLFIFFIIGRWN